MGGILEYVLAQFFNICINTCDSGRVAMVTTKTRQMLHLCVLSDTSEKRLAYESLLKMELKLGKEWKNLVLTDMSNIYVSGVCVICSCACHKYSTLVAFMVFVVAGLTFQSDQLCKSRRKYMQESTYWVSFVSLSFFRTTPSQCISSRVGETSVWRTGSWTWTWLWITVWQTSCGSLTPTSLMTRSPSCTAWQWRTEWSACIPMAPSCTDWGERRVTPSPCCYF